MKLVIVIERPELSELFAVGVKDLVNNFIPDWMHVQPEDVKVCRFEELRDESGENIITMKEAFMGGKPYTVIKHQDNLCRGNVT